MSAPGAMNDYYAAATVKAYLDAELATYASGACSELLPCILGGDMNDIENECIVIASIDDSERYNDGNRIVTIAIRIQSFADVRTYLQQCIFAACVKDAFSPLSAVIVSNFNAIAAANSFPVRFANIERPTRSTFDIDGEFRIHELTITADTYSV